MDALEVLLSRHGFRGRARRVRCFAHTLNLVAKATLRQFEKRIGKKKKRTDNNEPSDFDDLPILEPYGADENADDDDFSESELPDLEDLAIQDDDDGEKNVRDEEEIVTVFQALTPEEHEQEVRPVRSALFKVSYFVDM